MLRRIPKTGVPPNEIVRLLGARGGDGEAAMGPLRGVGKGEFFILFCASFVLYGRGVFFVCLPFPASGRHSPILTSHATAGL